jgi:hypothetical protein
MAEQVPAYKQQLIDKIVWCLKDLEEDCLQVILSQAQALLKGHQEYGTLDLDNYSKDALLEAVEEARDLSNYLTFRLIQLKRIDN